MTNDFEFGRVIAVDTSQVTIELNKDIKAMTLATYESTNEVGRINSYVIIPVASRKIVGMVTRVVMAEEAEIKTDKTMVSLPSARRIMKATMIGTIEGDIFKQGISIFPVLDSPVLVAARKDLESIFGERDEKRQIDRDNPGYCIPIGNSVVSPDFGIRINPDLFFGKHAAIIGSTGTGKSCTITAIIQSILERQGVKNTNFIILDTNGEYRSAFVKDENDQMNGYDYRCLNIPTDPSQPDKRLIIPYWFMNSDDFVRMFRANVGLQAPVLKRAIGLSRGEVTSILGRNTTAVALLASLNRIRACCENDSPTQQWAIARNIKHICEDSLEFEVSFPAFWQQLKELEIDKSIEKTFNDIRMIAKEADEKDKDLGFTGIKGILDLVQKLYEVIEEKGLLDSRSICDTQTNPDLPSYFDLRKMVSYTIDIAMKEQAEAATPGRVREACSPMMIRIQHYINDPRFDFLFGHPGVEWKNVEALLATFIRDILGLGPPDGFSQSKQSISKGIFPFYDRLTTKEQHPNNIVIIDLSLLAAEVLENVTALIGRLILEFLQRIGEEETSLIKRGELPVVLILEEAQNYIPEVKGREVESISKEVYERIAREGRKYGLGLVVASQRPSELSKTVLSQCNSFIVHRLQNPEDLSYFRQIVPGIYKELLDQLPALAPRNALVLGECVSAPALTYIREANPIPKSKDPRFYKQWVADEPKIPNVEAVCRKWEGKVE